MNAFTKRLFFPCAVALVLAAMAACQDQSPPAADVCGEAKDRFASCGTSLPVLTDGPCSGSARIVARCVVDHAHDCEELATLFGRLDTCVADLLDGGDPLLPPATDLPAPARDAGRDSSSDDANGNTDAAPQPVEAGSTDAARSDSGTEI